MGDERHPNHGAGKLLGLVGRLGELDAAALAASAGMDLRFDDHDMAARAAQAARDLAGFRSAEGHVTSRDGHAVARENCFRLILVNFHDGTKLLMLTLRVIVTQQ